MKKILFATDDNINWFLLRVILGSVMLAHGLQKAFGWFNGFGWNNTIGYFNSVGIPSWLGAIIILLETLGAVLLILGFAGRVFAALLGIVMIGAFAIDHLPNGFFMNWGGQARGEGYEFDILFWTIAFVLTINGSGKYSIDRLITKKMSTERKTKQAFNTSMA